MSANPTGEQEKALDAFTTGRNMVIEAGAGTGKTTTLKMLAKSAPSEKGVYIAYNRAIANDAKESFPRSVRCSTAHGLAFRPVGLRYKHRLEGPRVTANQAANILGIRSGLSFGEGDMAMMFSPQKLTRLALDAVQKFCYSADSEIDKQHVAFIPGTEEYFAELRSYILPFARRAWEDIQKENGRLRFVHDHYLKMWAMTDPVLECDYIMLDEAQDANPVVAQIFEGQKHAQRIAVGDSAQQIYAWRGAVDYMSKMEAEYRLLLSQSFRFGEAVAEEANKWLELLEAPLRLSGFEQMSTSVRELPDGSEMTVLCRTNAEAVAQTMHAQRELGKQVAIVGGTGEIRRFAEAARDLKAGKGTSHPDLLAFTDWEQVKQYVEEDSGGTDLRVFVNLIEAHGPEGVMEIADQCVDEREAEVIVSTAHKAKGREWDQVKIATDFRQPTVDNDGSYKHARPEFMLAYVAVTRAQQVLDNEGLAWVDDLGRQQQSTEEEEVTNE